MDKNIELIELLGVWYVKRIDQNASANAFKYFITLASSRTSEVLDFATFIEYLDKSELTKQLLKTNTDLEILGETISQMERTVLYTKQKLIDGRFVEIQNELLEQMRLMYQTEGLSAEYEDALKELEQSFEKNEVR